MINLDRLSNKEQFYFLVEQRLSEGSLKYTTVEMIDNKAWKKMTFFEADHCSNFLEAIEDLSFNGNWEFKPLEDDSCDLFVRFIDDDEKGAKSVTIDLNRFVPKKYFRDTVGITASTMNNWIRRDEKVKVKEFPELGIELLDLDTFRYYSLPWGSARDACYYTEENKVRVKKRAKDLERMAKS